MLIFVQPLSDTLKQLKEVIDETAEADGIEVFEVESLTEMAQLLPTIGPSLTIISNPRKCAMMLQANRSSIIKMKSKVILVSPKAIPRKILEKFMKLALTDCIAEPVMPKTLLYKVKLMLRSLPSIDEEKDKDEEVVFSSDDDDAIDTDQAQLVEKGIKLEGHLKGKIQDKESASLRLVDEEEDEGIKSKTEVEIIEKEDPLVANLTPDLDLKLEKEEDDIDLDQNDGSIDGYYRGDVKSDLNLEEGDDPESETEEDDFDHDDLLEQAKAELNLDLVDDDNIYQTSKDSEEDVANTEDEEINNEPPVVLDIDEEETNPSGDKDHNILDGHMRGKIKQESLQLEDAPETEKEILEEEEIEKKSPFDDIASELILTDEDIQMEIDPDEVDETEPEEDDSEAPLSIDIEDEKDKDISQLEIEEDAENLAGEGSEADQLEKYYKGSVQEDLTIEEDEKRNDDPALEDIEKQVELEDENASIEFDIDLDTSELDEKAKDVTDLELEQDLDSEERELDDEEMNAAEKMKQVEQDPNLALEIEEFKKQKMLDAEEENRKSQDMQNSKKLALEDEDTQHADWETKEYGKLNRKAGAQDINLDLEDDKDGIIKNHGVDHIQKYYGVKGEDSLEVGGDWTNLNKKEEIIDLGEKTKHKGEKELVIPKIDRGEQTIDYSKLKNEFDVSISIERDKSVTTGEYKFGSNGEEDSEGTKLDIPEQDIFDEALTEEEQEIIASKETVYEPYSKGLEYVIKVLETYTDSKKDLYTILYQTGNSIFKETKGVTSFFTYNPQNETFNEEYSGHLFIDSGISKGLRESKWNSLKKDRLEHWSTTKLPIWQDHTFQALENEFIYPFFLSVNHMGFAIVSFASQIKEEESHGIEIILESTRGGYLNKYSSIKRAMDKDKDGGKEDQKTEKKGFLKGLFNKKAS